MPKLFSSYLFCFFCFIVCFVLFLWVKKRFSNISVNIPKFCAGSYSLLKPKTLSNSPPTDSTRCAKLD